MKLTLTALLLAGVMDITRKVDWYRLSPDGTQA